MDHKIVDQFNLIDYSVALAIICMAVVNTYASISDYFNCLRASFFGKPYRGDFKSLLAISPPIRFFPQSEKRIITVAKTLESVVCIDSP